MNAKLRIFRDEIVINQQFADFVAQGISTANMQSGDTLLIAARTCRHDPNYNWGIPNQCSLILAADQYDAAGGSIVSSGAAASGQGSAGAPGISSPSDDLPGRAGSGGPGPDGQDGGNLSLLARRLMNAQLVSNGGDGGLGGRGGFGAAPLRHRDPDAEGGFSFSAPGPGGTGGMGGRGGAGGRVNLVYVTQLAPNPAFQIQTQGGNGGVGGPGGTGAKNNQGTRSAPNGLQGQQGLTGLTGSQNISPLSEEAYWTAITNALGADALDWALYRERVGEYYFRTYRSSTSFDIYRGLALDEFQAALLLDPGLSQAKTNLDHLLNNRNILGIARDLDIFPDFERYEAFVTSGAQMVQAMLQFASQDLTTGVLGDFAVQSLQREIDHLASAKNVLQLDQQAAALGKQAADQEKAFDDADADRLKAQLAAKKEELENASISFGDVVGVVAAVASAVLAFPTGGASLLAFSPDLIAVASDIGATGVLNEVKDALHLNGKAGDGVWDQFAKDAGGLKTIIQKNYAEVKDLINVVQIIADIGNSKTLKKEYQDLLVKATQAAHAQLLAGLRSSQADVVNQAALAALSQRDDDEGEARDELGRVKAGNAALDAAAQAIIQASHTYFDTVAKFAFYAARALEIYTLIDQSAEIRYDYGYVHPDLDQDYLEKRITGAQVAAAYQAVWSSLPEVAHLGQQYLDYFNATGADFTRDVMVQSIKNGAALAAFRQQRSIDVVIALSAPGFFGRSETKVEVVAVALIGVQNKSEVLDCIVEHGGISEQQKRDGTLVTQYLARHDTVVQVKFQPLTPSDLSGDPRTDPLSAPRTVAFWGRGVATSWRLTIEDPSVNLDGISEIQFGVGFTGFLSPDVQFTLPAPESTVSGTVTVRAKATRVSGIQFQAQYSDGAAVGWHDLEGSKETAPGVWEATWDTRSVPNQGDAALGTVMLAAVAVDANGNDLNRSKYCRVEVKNGV